jgi:hypothetical protein
MGDGRRSCPSRHPSHRTWESLRELTHSHRVRRTNLVQHCAFAGQVSRKMLHPERIAACEMQRIQTQENREPETDKSIGLAACNALASLCQNMRRWRHAWSRATQKLATICSTRVVRVHIFQANRRTLRNATPSQTPSRRFQHSLQRAHFAQGGAAMFGSTILDVAIGLVFVFLLCSLVASAVREGIEAWTKTRASQLEAGLREILRYKDGKQLLQQFYDHPLISALYQGPYNPASKRTASTLFKGSNLPSYIPSHNFALALLDMTARGPEVDGSQATTPVTLDSIRKNVGTIANPFCAARHPDRVGPCQW